MSNSKYICNNVVRLMGLSISSPPISQPIDLLCQTHNFAKVKGKASYRSKIYRVCFSFYSGRQLLSIIKVFSHYIYQRTVDDNPLDTDNHSRHTNKYINYGNVFSYTRNVNYRSLFSHHSLFRVRVIVFYFEGDSMRW